MRKTLIALSVAVLLFGVAGIAAAQTETSSSTTLVDSESIVEVRNATVVAVYGNHLVLRRENGEEFDYTVPDDWRFNIDGKSLKASELIPGTMLTAQVKTTTTANKVVTTTVRTGEVLKVMGRTLIYRGHEGVKKVVVPSDFIFDVGGQDKTIFDLREGMILTATIVSEAEPVLLTERQLASEISGTAGSTAASSASTASTSSTSSSSTTSSTLPSTGSLLPLIGLLGLASLVLGAALTVIRRF